MEKGYEQTSVRRILEKSGVTTGSFYHFFPSKQELFEAVIAIFLTDYVSTFASICEDHELPVLQRYELLCGELAKRMQEYYGQLGGNNLHWSIAYGLHEKTVRALLPGVEVLLTDAIKTGSVKSRIDIDVRTLSMLLIRGMEAILHSKSDFNGTETERTEYCFLKYREYLRLLLDVGGAE